MRCLVVGGWVRDTLLSKKDASLAPKDKDWVVLGATPAEMEKAGFTPVGKDFPVFLHPKTHEEYALARTERKCGRGYHGFVFCASPDVRLEEDLARRDLTINAMAMDEDGRLIDPYGGLGDLERGILRHVSPSFVEDPVRLLRIARFAARFPNFRVAEETEKLLCEMVQTGETDALVPERVFAEMQKAFKEARVSPFFYVIELCGYKKRSLPGWRVPEALLQKLDRAYELTPEEKLALSFMETEQAARESFVHKLHLPVRFADLVLLAAPFAEDMRNGTQSTDSILRVLERYDALRRPERFALLLRICQAYGVAAETAFWEAAQDAVRQLDMASLMREKPQGVSVRDYVRTVKKAALLRLLEKSSDQHDHNADQNRTCER